MDKIKKGDKSKNIKKRHLITVLIIIAVLIILILFGARIYLFTRLLIGYDIMIKLSVDKENLFLSHGESEKIQVRALVVTNPFCNAYCKYWFTDLSSMEVLDKNNFSIKLANPYVLDYNITSPNTGSGQKLYRFDMECRGFKKGLCATKEESTKRSLLITLDYNLTKNEKLMKEETRDKYNRLTKSIPNSIFILKNFLRISKGSVIFNYSRSDIESVLNIFEYLNKSLSEFRDIWENEDYYQSYREISRIEKIFSESEDFNDINQSFYSDIDSYNILVENLSLIEKRIKNYQEANLTNKSAGELNDLIVNFNNIKREFIRKSSLDEKKSYTDYIKNKS
ncbi:hypothetical protein GF386_00790, partial [Candidatus Pacearchaeota archaeon]|nr:hypothetical protein [Candidatus Pacearchaeota archaeon]MBD3282795.1 hypothetical protein [Candidatus Pacearchaeota archaeon]